MNCFVYGCDGDLTTRMIIPQHEGPDKKYLMCAEHTYEYSLIAADHVTMEDLEMRKVRVTIKDMSWYQVTKDVPADWDDMEIAMAVHGVRDDWEFQDGHCDYDVAEVVEVLA